MFKFFKTSQSIISLINIYKSLTKDQKVISLINIRGSISDGNNFIGNSTVSLRSLDKNIQKAFNNPNTLAVALSINSPGGSPVQSELIYHRIKELSEQTKIPVMAFIEDYGASGGYMIACSANDIYCMESSIVGSIGVVASGFGFQNLIEKIGIERRIYSEGENKVILDPYKEADENDINIIKNISKNIHNNFKDIVNNSRQDRIKYHSNGGIFTGMIWTGKRAKSLGLVDGIGDLNYIIKQKYGDVKIVEMKESSSLMNSIITTFTSSLSSSLMTQINSTITHILQRNKFY